MFLRPATRDDAATLAEIHIAGWRASYDGLVDPAFLDGLDVEKRTKDWQDWLSSGTDAIIAYDDQGGGAGFISFGRLKTPPPGVSQIRPLYSAEIYALYILPAYWRQKLGRQLMAAAAKALKIRKHKSLCLWVVEKNTRAVAFYKALGGQKCGGKTVDIGGRHLSDTAFGWRDTAILYPSEDKP